MALPLRGVLLAAIGVTVLAGMVSAGIVLDRRLAAALEERARSELRLMPGVLADRNARVAEALMMYAKELAHTPGLADALANRDRAGAVRLATTAASKHHGLPVLVGPRGERWMGPVIEDDLLGATRRGQMPVATVLSDDSINTVALAPVEVGGAWVGATGFAVPVDAQVAGTLAGLTRSGVVVIASSGRVMATTLDTTTTRAVAAALSEGGSTGPSVLADSVRDVQARARRYLTIVAPLGTAGSIVFVRPHDEELRILPQLRRVALVSAVIALLTAILLGALVAGAIARPVQQLSTAAGALAAGRFDAPLPASSLREVAHVAAAFDAMRRALAARLAELEAANAALADRSARLTALQADLIQRDRLAATGRLVAQLAHEVRNPVASLRNCLEILRRRLDDDPEGREFADLAIDELLRMHELAEQMLDLNRPRSPDARECDVDVVAREVTRLVSLETPAAEVTLHVDSEPDVRAAIAPDALKQVLLNLVHNAREAIAHQPTRTGSGRVDVRIRRAGASIVVDVIDNGPGIPATELTRVFDPFFTTKDAMHGVGLGLYVAEGLVRSAGGRIDAGNEPRTGGARFHIELPAAETAHWTPPPAAATEGSR